MRRWGGDDPRALIPHPKWYLARNESESVELSTFIVSDNEFNDYITISADDLEKWQNRSDFMKEEPPGNSTRALIVDALRLYSQAMDDRFRDGCFLGLWQVLEVIALSDEVNGRTDKICSRIQWHSDHLDLPGSGIRYTLKCLSEKRNDLVHRGVRSIDDDDVNVLKTIVEVSLSWLIGVMDELTTTHHLSAYYEYRTSGDTEIDSVSDTLDYIKEER